MTILKKRLIYLSFFLVFFVVSPLLLSYASGYRYNFQKKLVQRTGAISVVTNPEDAEIFIEGELFDKMSPAVITDLLPREYSIEVRKEGFRSWQRQIEIKSARSVLLNDIQLFKSAIIPRPIESLSADLQSQYATSSHVIIGNSDISLEMLVDRYDLISTSVFSSATTSLTTLPKSDYSLYMAVNDWLVIEDELNRIIYLFEVSGNSLKNEHIISNVNGFDWDTSGNNLLYYNDFELWTLDTNSGKKNLITRISAGVDNALWHPGGHYIIYQTGIAVKIVELVQAIDRQAYDVMDFIKIEDLVVNDSGDLLYVDGALAGKVGWFELEIQ